MDKDVYDTIIIGGGPAGLTAGIYACRAQLKTLLIECFSPSSQAVAADLIENYPGFPEGIDGFSLIERFRKQAKNLGVEFKVAEVKNVGFVGERDKTWQINLDNETCGSLTVILAVGTRHRHLEVPGEKEFSGKGVSYCAICDGALFKDKDIVVVGGGDSAVSEALYLTRFAHRVKLVHRRNSLRAVGLLSKRALENNKIEILWNSTVTQIYGDSKVQGVDLKNVVDGSLSKIACSAVFVSVGYIPNTDFLANLIKLDASGYIITDELMQTSKPGAFACGDCRLKPLRQVVTACGDAAVAAFGAIKYVDQIKGASYDTK